MRPENRFAQMTSKEQIAFILSDEGKDFTYSFGINVEGKGYPISVSGKWSRPSMMKVLVSSRRALGRVALEFLGPPSCSSLVVSMPPPPSPKTAEAADLLPTRTGAETRTRTTSFGPAAASARRGRWLLRR